MFLNVNFSPSAFGLVRGDFGLASESLLKKFIKARAFVASTAKQNESSDGFGLLLLAKMVRAAIHDTACFYSVVGVIVWSGGLEGR